MKLAGISEEKLSFYEKNGFVQLEDVFTEKEMEELSLYLDDVMAIEGEYTKSVDKSSEFYKILNSKVNTWRDSAGMAKYSLSPRLAEIARQFSGSSGVRLFHDQAFWKMPGDSKPTPWHQDGTYFPIREPNVLTMWIPMDDVDTFNGCLSFIPESHKAGKLTNVDFLHPIDLLELTKDTGADLRRPVNVPLKRGSCTLHHGLTFHYAYANKSDKPRRVLTIVYMPEDATFDAKIDHELTRDCGFQEGSGIRGRLFPVLASASAT
jgi:ectoine hydroxylase-related dioxygenase (phytanoyl-CoA dioxygenase family)